MSVGMLSVFGLMALSFAVFSQGKPRLIWNRTDSAPKGLYWLSDDPFTKGRWVVVSASSGPAQWAETRGYIGRDWPLLKQISGVSGDQICRDERDILINGRRVGTARIYDAQGRLLPVWEGCFTLQADEVFLLNWHPSSLDGRYFGATSLSDLQGVAVLIWEFRP